MQFMAFLSKKSMHKAPILGFSVFLIPFLAFSYGAFSISCIAFGFLNSSLFDL
jgi:hypothetical protein